MKTKAVFKDLDKELEKKGCKRKLYICGGAALIALKIVARTTRDVDVIKPEIDSDLMDAAKIVANKHGLDENWLNNAPYELADMLPKGWMSECDSVFKDSSLEIRALGRLNLLRTKLFAACDRIDDLDDMVALNPSDTEIEEAEKWVLPRKAGKMWTQVVNECVKELRGRMKDNAE